MRYFLAAILLTICATSASASIIYNVNRTIDAGSVTGFIETDGTLGTLSTANITSWILTITAPNIGGGTPSVIDSTSVTSDSQINGNVVTATSSQLLFDFSPGATGLFILQDHDFWCLEIGDTCTGAGDGEHIGYPDGSGGGVAAAAQTALYSGSTVIATVVPVPAAAWLFGSGLACLFGTARRNKS